MNIITISQTTYGPTDHFGGNSLANKTGLAHAAVEAIGDVIAGDWLDESVYDLDDLTRDELDHFLRSRGLRRGDMMSDGCQIVNAG